MATRRILTIREKLENKLKYLAQKISRAVRGVAPPPQGANHPHLHLRADDENEYTGACGWNHAGGRAKTNAEFGQLIQDGSLLLCKNCLKIYEGRNS